MFVDSYGIHLGPLYLRFYGLLVMSGVALGGFVGRRVLREMAPKRDPDLVWDALIWAVFFGVVGARIYHIFTPSQSLLELGIDTRYYLTHPLDAINITAGGLGMPGAILGGVFGLYLYGRRNRVPLTLILDVAAPGLAIGHALGRWGNYINQELYGPPTDLPWGIFIRPENRLTGFEAFETFHPLFIYEAIWNLGTAGVILWAWRRYGDRLKSGDMFLIYLVGYPLGRFLLEFLRIDYVPAFGLNLNQALMLVVALASAAGLYYRHRMAPSRRPTGARSRR